MAERVLITGAAGFIGRALAARLREGGAEVRGVDLRADAAAGIVAGDTARPGAWQRAAEGCELVVHAAAMLALRGDARRFWEVNVLGTRHALDAAVRGGARRFVHLSSVTAFGYEFPDGVDERHPVRTTGSPYVDTKVASEQVVLQAHAAGELACTVVRPADVYGPGSWPWTVLPVQLLRARRLALPARGRGVFSPVYVDDLVAGVLLAAAAPDAAGQVITVGGAGGVATREFFGRYAALLGMRLPTVPTALALPGSWLAWQLARVLGGDQNVNPDSVRYLSRTGTYSIERARRLLGYEPGVGLDEGFERTAAWLRAEGLVP